MTTLVAPWPLPALLSRPTSLAGRLLRGVVAVGLLAGITWSLLATASSPQAPAPGGPHTYVLGGTR